VIDNLDNDKHNYKISELRNKYFIEPKRWTATQTQEWLHQLGPWANSIATIAKKSKISKLIFNKKS
jgi:hypothetical protein